MANKTALIVSGGYQVDLKVSTNKLRAGLSPSSDIVPSHS